MSVVWLSPEERCCAMIVRFALIESLKRRWSIGRVNIIVNIWLIPWQVVLDCDCYYDFYGVCVYCDRCIGHRWRCIHCGLWHADVVAGSETSTILAPASPPTSARPSRPPHVSKRRKSESSSSGTSEDPQLVMREKRQLRVLERMAQRGKRLVKEQEERLKRLREKYSAVPSKGPISVEVKKEEKDGGPGTGKEVPSSQSRYLPDEDDEVDVEGDGDTDEEMEDDVDDEFEDEEVDPSVFFEGNVFDSEDEMEEEGDDWDEEDGYFEDSQVSLTAGFAGGRGSDVEISD